MTRKNCNAFTLAELLIALAILGVIATFTIPKVLQAQQAQQYRSTTKDTLAMISGALNVYKLNNGSGAQPHTIDLLPYMNYVKTDTSSTIGSVPGMGPSDCSDTNYQCIRLHNGGLLFMENGNLHCGGFPDTALMFGFNPDPTGNTTPIGIYIYPNNRIYTNSGIIAWTGICGDSSGGWFYNIFATPDPPWFSWN